jgi:hypothetical protein
MIIHKKTSVASSKTYRTPQHRPFPHALRRGCKCPGCSLHLSRLEKLNSQLAGHADALRRENDALRQQLQERQVA